MDNIKTIFLAIFCPLLAGCSATLPENAQETNTQPNLYPNDYIDALIPKNIAPMNFVVDEDADDIMGLFVSNNGREISLCETKDKSLQLKKNDWEQLKENADEIKVYIYAKKGDKWQKFKPFSFFISPDSIDKYITYRLIEPSYQASGEMGLFATDIETGTESRIVTVSKQYSDPSDRGQMCVNCHHTQKKTDGISMFYARNKNGGLIITNGKKIKKINTKTGDMPNGTSYASIHPSKPLIAMASPFTRQMFHTTGKRKLDVYDWSSDLMLYDFESNNIRNILRTKDKQESFPEWSADGKSLYFISSDSVFNMMEYKNMKYELMQIDFSADSMSWSEPRKILSYADKDSSLTMPKASPDGHYLAITKSAFGLSTQTNETADLIMLDLKENKIIDTRSVNSNEADSYHSWSGNSKWMVLASKRENGNYMRLYIFHIGENGELSKPFTVPRKNPLYNRYLMKCYNVPELTNKLPLPSENDYEKVMLDAEVENAVFASPIDSTNLDAKSGASKVEK